MIVFCGGMMRAGSVLQFLLADGVVRANGAGRSPVCNGDGKEELHFARWSLEDQIYVFKGHGPWRDKQELMDEIAAERVQVLTTIRDPRDIMVSMMSKWGRSLIGELREQNLQRSLEDAVWWKANVPVQNLYARRYEDFWDDLVNEAHRIAEFLDLPLLEGQARQIAKGISLERNRERSARLEKIDPATYLTAGHVTSDGKPGQWWLKLADWQVAAVERVAGGWMDANGYARRG